MGVRGRSPCAGSPNNSLTGIEVVDPRHTTIEHVVSVIMRFRKHRQKVYAVVAVNPQDDRLVEPFWQRLRGAFAGPSEKRLIVILAVSEDPNSTLPEGIIRLEPPKLFDENALYDWLRQINSASSLSDLNVKSLISSQFAILAHGKLQ